MLIQRSYAAPTGRVVIGRHFLQTFGSYGAGIGADVSSSGANAYVAERDLPSMNMNQGEAHPRKLAIEQSAPSHESTSPRRGNPRNRCLHDAFRVDRIARLHFFTFYRLSQYICRLRKVVISGAVPAANKLLVKVAGLV